ncbi:OmpA family protein [Altererythrobacter arenosus]|uniref:OmpA family protein n=1 Tax=Altererythrobacter arenosus TaxID=3032592 RepID=A0ABY8FNP0_9SPHN|nr:OmpA family protein [Altererythrobacter sp. CAU 1644]WFL76633.1 OmpA family protein [Altererythrobacter sp. CAU 1644]
MRFKKTSAATATLVMALAMHQGAQAQTNDADALMALDNDSLRGEIQTRFDAALAASNDGGVVNADDTRFVWANEAKAQCGIALGYLKSGTKDPVSVGKCARATALMQDNTRRVPVPLWAAGEAPAICEDPKLIFFGFDIAEPPAAEAQQVVDFVAGNFQTCGWNSIAVVGHADRSGSVEYNMRLAQERATNVYNMLAEKVPANMLAAPASKGEGEPRVPTEDGVREPQNRRVEIQVSK